MIIVTPPEKNIRFEIHNYLDPFKETCPSCGHVGETCPFIILLCPCYLYMGLFWT